MKRCTSKRHKRCSHTTASKGCEAVRHWSVKREDDSHIGGGRVLANFVPSPQFEAPEPTAAYWATDTGQVALSDDSYPLAEHRPMSDSGYRITRIDPDDVDQIRVREAVRDFGWLASRRDIKYAGSIGMDWDGFVTGMLEPEVDHLAQPLEAGDELEVPAIVAPVRPLTTLEDIATWRENRGVPIATPILFHEGGI